VVRVCNYNAYTNGDQIMAVIDYNSTIGQVTLYFAQYVVGDITIALILLIFLALAFCFSFRLPMELSVVVVYPLIFTFLLVSSAPQMVTMLGIFVLYTSIMAAKVYFLN